MIDLKKVRLMTRLAMYEKHEGQEDIQIGKYYKADYVRMNILKTILAVTIGSFLVLLMVIVYHLEFLLNQAMVLNYSLLFKWVLGYYLVILVIEVGITSIGYHIKYISSRGRLSGYYKRLGQLKKLEEEELRQRELAEGEEV